jgi:DivIVA domain-containing protein
MAGMTRALTADDVRGAVFSTPPLGERGYDKKSVDDFLQLVARRLA